MSSSSTLHATHEFGKSVMEPPGTCSIEGGRRPTGLRPPAPAKRLTAEQVPVRHKEGLMHGFLALRTLEGKKLADGEMTQVTEGDRLIDDLIFRFKDGS